MIRIKFESRPFMFVCVKVRALRLNFLTSFTFLIELLERVAESGTRV